MQIVSTGFDFNERAGPKERRLQKYLERCFDHGVDPTDKVKQSILGGNEKWETWGMHKLPNNNLSLTGVTPGELPSAGVLKLLKQAGFPRDWGGWAARMEANFAATSRFGSQLDVWSAVRLLSGCLEGSATAVTVWGEQSPKECVQTLDGDQSVLGWWQGEHLFKAGQTLRRQSLVWERYHNPILNETLKTGWSGCFNYKLEPAWFTPTEKTEDLEAISEAVNRLLAMEAIAKVDEPFLSKFGPPECVLPLFLDKSVKDGKIKIREIWNAQYLNVAESPPPFVLPNVGQVKFAASKGCWCAKIDMAQGWFQIPLAESVFPKVCFLHKQKLFYWKVLPFGLSSAPFVFQSFTDVLVSHLRKAVCWCYGYIDDVFAIFPNQIKADEQYRSVLEIIRQHGFVMKIAKRSESPQQTEVFLGITVAMAEQRFSVPDEKFQKTKASLNQWISQPAVRLLDVAAFIGKVLSWKVACQGVSQLGWQLYKWLNTALLNANQNWSAKARMPMVVKQKISMFLERFAILNGMDFFPKCEAWIRTDASQAGYGGVVMLAGNRVTPVAGLWDKQQQDWHINEKELWAVVLTVKLCSAELRGKTVQLRLDNQVAVAYIRREGGGKKLLNEMSESLMQATSEINCKIASVSYLPSIRNVVADALSRLGQDTKKFTLSREVVGKFLRWVGNKWPSRFPKVHTLTTVKEQVLPVGQSEFREDGREMAFFDCQLQEVFLAVPRFSLLRAVVDHIEQFRGKGWVLTPMWKRAEWFPFFKKQLGPKFVLPTRTQRVFNEGMVEWGACIWWVDGGGQTNSRTGSTRGSGCP